MLRGVQYLSRSLRRFRLLKSFSLLHCETCTTKSSCSKLRSIPRCLTSVAFIPFVVEPFDIGASGSSADVAISETKAATMLYTALNMQRINSEGGQQCNVVDDSTAAAERKAATRSLFRSFLGEFGSFETQALGLGILGANLIVFISLRASICAYGMTKRSSFVKFMARNFILSSDALRKKRPHVWLTSVFTHLHVKHLIGNSLLTWVSTQACSRSLNVWEIAGLYLSGGIVGNVTSIALAGLLRKPQYRASSMGGSAALFSLFSFYWYTQENETSSSGYMFTDIAMRAAIFRELLGIAVYVRHGYKGKGYWSVRVGHVAHMAGIITGILAYRLKDSIKTIAADPCAIVSLIEDRDCGFRLQQRTLNSTLTDPSETSKS